jgi:hypothetical protein
VAGARETRPPGAWPGCSHVLEPLQIGETRSNFFVDNSSGHVQLRVPKIKISTSSPALRDFFERC